MQVRQGPQDLLVPVEPLGRRVHKVLRACRVNLARKARPALKASRGFQVCKVNQALKAYRVHLGLLAPKALLALLVVIASLSRWNPPATSLLVQTTTTSCFWPTTIR